MTSHFTRELADEAATLEAGRQFSEELSAGQVVYLHGDLGAGKTTFVRGVLQGLGHEGRVKSPTYTLVEPYVISRYDFYHFDLYRFNDDAEWEVAGFREHFNPSSVCMIEWPGNASNVLPNPDYDIRIGLLNDNDPSDGRKIEVIAY